MQYSDVQLDAAWRRAPMNAMPWPLRHPALHESITPTHISSTLTHVFNLLKSPPSTQIYTHTNLHPHKSTPTQIYTNTNLHTHKSTPPHIYNHTTLHLHASQQQTSSPMHISTRCTEITLMCQLIGGQQVAWGPKNRKKRYFDVNCISFFFCKNNNFISLMWPTLSFINHHR